MTPSRPIPTLPRPDEFDRKTISLTADFLEAAFDDADILAGLPQGALFISLPENVWAFVEESIALGVEAVRQGRDVIFRHLAGAKEPVASH